MKITVLGAGAWGTALAIYLGPRHQTTLWGRDREQVALLAKERRNGKYLPGYPLPENVALDADIESALRGADLAVIAVPASGLRATARKLSDCAAGLPVIWACKGLEAESGKLPHQVVAEEIARTSARGVLSGPTFAEEIARGLPTAITLASSDMNFSNAAAKALHGSLLRVYSSQDVIGVEVGGALKNVMAIAAGISDGMGFGHNARAGLITRGLAELSRLGLKLGGRQETFMGLSGMGDLILTCTGDLSRNRRVGLMLAQGQPLPEILKHLGHVAEGVYTAKAAKELSQRLAIEMPITLGLCDVLYRGVPAGQAVAALLRREPKTEN